jgi:PAS domain S-box-containing protein
MIALSTKKVGEIIHANDEIYRILGYKRKNLIGKNINVIMPGPIGMVHDKYLRRFLETAKNRIIEEIRQMPALCADGYIRTVSLCIKLYP